MSCTNVILFQVKVIAYDGGDPSKSGSVNILIQILDANDNDPHFDNNTYEVEVKENVPPDTPIIKVSLTVQTGYLNTQRVSTTLYKQ